MLALVLSFVYVNSYSKITFDVCFYREKKKVLLNNEHRIMLRMAPDYDHLPLMNKVEASQEPSITLLGSTRMRHVCVAEFEKRGLA
jgi:hypothetical protein